jgi:hypothetical protein
MMQHQFNIQLFYILPTLYLFVLISEQTVNSALYNIDWFL